MTFYIAPVVEGQTEQGCLERLLQRTWHELLARPERLQVIEPFRGHRDSLVHLDGKVLTESVGKAALKLRSVIRKDAEARSLLLVLLDAEDECPATLAPRLMATAVQAIPSEIGIACVLAKRMLENWIVAGCSTLTSVNDLPSQLQPPLDVEACHGAGWLDSKLRSLNRGRKYSKTADAKVFVNEMDLKACRSTSPSFDKLCRELELRVPPSAPEPPEETPPPDTPEEN